MRSIRFVPGHRQSVRFGPMRRNSELRAIWADDTSFLRLLLRG